jgi:hypothetical protein
MAHDFRTRRNECKLEFATTVVKPIDMTVMKDALSISLDPRLCEDLSDDVRDSVFTSWFENVCRELDVPIVASDQSIGFTKATDVFYALDYLTFLKQQPIRVRRVPLPVRIRQSKVRDDGMCDVAISIPAGHTPFNTMGSNTAIQSVFVTSTTKINCAKTCIDCQGPLESEEAVEIKCSICGDTCKDRCVWPGLVILSSDGGNQFVYCTRGSWTLTMHIYMVVDAATFDMDNIMVEGCIVWMPRPDKRVPYWFWEGIRFGHHATVIDQVSTCREDCMAPNKHGCGGLDVSTSTKVKSSRLSDSPSIHLLSLFESGVARRRKALGSGSGILI